jgi:hypothetical protein
MRIIVNRVKVVAVAFCFVFGLAAVLGTQPMPFFAMIEGGGGGGGGGGYPITVTSPYLISNGLTDRSWYTWDNGEQVPGKTVAYARVETELVAISIELRLVSLHNYGTNEREVGMYVTTSSTWKGSRPTGYNEGALLGVRIDVQKTSTYYKGYQRALWQTDDCHDYNGWPELFYQSYPEDLDPAERLGISLGITALTVWAGLGLWAGAAVAVGSAFTLFLLGATQYGSWDSLSTSDMSGYSVWDNMDATQYVKYPGPNWDEVTNPNDYTYNFARDCSTQNYLCYRISKSLATGVWVGLRFRATLWYDYGMEPVSQSTPWTTLYYYE